MNIVIGFLSTYPPRECGLASFTSDLVNGLEKVQSKCTPKVIAVSDDRKNYCYDNRVIMELKQHDRESYTDVAKKINDSDIRLLVIEHEYGIFGGECGEYLLDLIDNINKIPIITTLHTVLPNPLKKQYEILKSLGKKSEKIVTMARNTIPILKNVYEIDEEKIEVIHHGVPSRKVQPREKLKEKYGLSGRTVVSTFGLISPGKGLEYGIEAIADVAKKHSDVIYLILGQTHPSIKTESGESYRDKLETLVADLGISENVKFVNKYLTIDEIIEYLQLSDIYMTPYLGKDQAVSGTLAYAVGYGKVIVSTPYSYAKEMLSDGRGLLAQFKDSKSLAECICYVLEHPEEKEAMEQKTLELGKTMTWENVAKQYAGLFSGLVQ
ncbi:MAG TPA: glycosyltransferase [Clostridiaceae bacterium]|nr:glycosyltransferase [Clostridiaceae bacterium]